MEASVVSISHDADFYYVEMSDGTSEKIQKDDVTDEQRAQLKTWKDAGNLVQWDMINRKQWVLEVLSSLHIQALALERELAQNAKAPAAVSSRLSDINDRILKIRSQIE